MLSSIKEDSIIKAYNLNTAKLEPKDREKLGLLKIEKNKIYFHLDKERYLKLEIIGETKEKEIKNAFCSNAFLAAQVLNLSENQERQVLELKCHFFKRPIKILPEPLNINFKDTIVKKLLKKMGKDKKLEDFKKTCILKIAGFTYFVCVLPYEDEDKEDKENSDSDNNTADTMDEFLKEILSSYQTRALKLTKRVKEKIFKNDPTENQEKAIEIALNTPDIAIIQGSPGTGKTTVINAICERLFEEYPKDKNIKGQILLCAQGHDVTNNVRERIKVGGLPTFKFGAKQNAKEEQYKQDERLNEQLREFAETLIESVRKKLQSLGDYENIKKFWI
ncbi:AAA domain-containing protein [Helicobacter pylori]